MKWRSTKLNVRFSPINSLRYLTFSSVRAVFGRPLVRYLGFRSVADPRLSTSLLLSLSKASNPFPDMLQHCSVSKTKFSQCRSIRALSSYDILSIIKVIGLTAIDLKYWRIYYKAMLHVNVNIKIMTSQQMWYLLLSYFNNKINFLFSCEIRSWSLRFHQFDICQVNTTQTIRWCTVLCQTN